MKRIIGVILTLIAANSFAGKIPEAKILHPDLYTIQFTHLHFDSDIGAFYVGEEEKQVIQEYNNLLEDLYDEEEIEEATLTYYRNRRKARIKGLESLDGEYTDLATVYTSSGERFPEAYTNVTGMLDLESNTLFLGGFNFSKRMRHEIEWSIDDFRVNEWRLAVEGVRGDVESHFLLIKCYPPINVSSYQNIEPISANAQSVVPND